MAYKLQVKLPDGKYKSLNIAKADRFDIGDAYEEYRNSKRCKIDKKTFELQIKTEQIKYSMKMIDKFTMQFRDELELKLYLVSVGILDKSYIDCPLFIRYMSDKKERRNYKVFFTDEYFYFDVDRLIELIENRYSSGDFEFLRAFANRFRDFNECNATAGELYALTIEVLQQGRISNGFEELDSNKDNVVRRLTKLLIYRYDIKPNGDPKYRKEGKDCLNWSTLHLLIEFIRDYEEREKQREKAIKGTTSEIPKNKTKVLEPPKTDNKYTQVSFREWLSDK